MSSRLCLQLLLLICLSALLFCPAPPGAGAQSRRLEDMPPPPPLPSRTPPKTAQTEREGDEISEGDVVSVSTTEILLPVTVRDGGGRLVTTLSQKDFRIFEDGREQPLTDFALRKVPVDVLLMVDASSSVANNLDDFQRAVEEFAQKLAPDDRVSLIKFDDRVELLLDWTPSLQQLRRALRRITPGVFTRFNDALYLAAHEQFRDASRRHAIVVLTDGIDSGRGYASNEVAVRELLKGGVSVYVISNTEIERARKRAELDTLLAGTTSSVRFNELRIQDLQEGLRVLEASERNLAEVAAVTGGRLYKPASFNGLDRVYSEVADDLRHQYSIYYSPLNKSRDGSFRRVRVSVTNPSLRVTARVGYYAPAR